MINNFTVTTNNKEYKCYSKISGKNILSQRITVESIGSKYDPASYGGRNYHSPKSMPAIAKLIAFEIIRENRNQYSIDTE